MDDKLSEIFDIAPIEITHSDGSQTVLPPEGTEEDVDFDFVRANHYLLAQQATEAMQTALKVVRQSEDPRAIDSLTKLMSAAADLNRQLLLLNKDKADTKTAKNSPQTTTTPSVTHVQQQVVFTGSSADLNKMMHDEDD